MYFATLFDRNYIPRAELMMESLIYHLGKEFSKIFILSLDEDVTSHFLGNPTVECVSLKVMEGYFPELQLAKANRSFVEYIFTLSPYFPMYILENYTAVKRITSLDSDLYFFASPGPILKSLGTDNIGITAHNFPEGLKYLEKFGKYNVSFQSFPNNSLGRKCLKDWANDCLEYCGDELDSEGRFADQQYLDSWIDRYSQVQVFPSPEFGLAPWNIHNYPIELDSPFLKLNDKQVVFYHFQGIRAKRSGVFQLGLSEYLDEKPSKNALRLYIFYLKKLNRKSTSNDAQIGRLQKTKKGGKQSMVMDFKFHPMLVKSGPFYNYLDLRKLVNFVEKKFKITRWQI